MLQNYLQPKHHSTNLRVLRATSDQTSHTYMIINKTQESKLSTPAIRGRQCSVHLQKRIERVCYVWHQMPV